MLIIVLCENPQIVIKKCFLFIEFYILYRGLGILRAYQIIADSV